MLLLAHGEITRHSSGRCYDLDGMPALIALMLGLLATRHEEESWEVDGAVRLLEKSCSKAHHIALR